MKRNTELILEPAFDVGLCTVGNSDGTAKGSFGITANIHRVFTKTLGRDFGKVTASLDLGKSLNIGIDDVLRCALRQERDFL